jgi:hypothetical protein
MVVASLESSKRCGSYSAGKCLGGCHRLLGATEGTKSNNTAQGGAASLSRHYSEYTAATAEAVAALESSKLKLYNCEQVHGAFHTVFVCILDSKSHHSHFFTPVCKPLANVLMPCYL